MKVPFYETSAKTGVGINDALSEMVKALIKVEVKKEERKKLLEAERNRKSSCC